MTDMVERVALNTPSADLYGHLIDEAVRINAEIKAGRAKVILAAMEENGFAKILRDAGFAIVPVEPTDAMIKDGSAAIQSDGFVDGATVKGYRAMLKAHQNEGEGG